MRGPQDPGQTLLSDRTRTTVPLRPFNEIPGGVRISSVARFYITKNTGVRAPLRVVAGPFRPGPQTFSHADELHPESAGQPLMAGTPRQNSRQAKLNP